MLSKPEEFAQRLQFEHDAAAPASKFGSSGLVFGVVSVIVVSGCLASWYLLGHRSAAEATTGNDSVVAQTREQPTLVPPPQVLASGFVVAARRATISSEVSGRISQILVDVGSSVEAGQVVATLDSQLAIAELRIAESRKVSADAAVSLSQSELEEANRVLNRVRALWASGHVSEAKVSEVAMVADTMVEKVNQAFAAREVAQWEVQRATQLVSKHTTLAPFDGVVVATNAQVGEFISPGSAGGGFTRTGILTMVDMDSLYLEVDLNEKYAGSIACGSHVAISSEAHPGADITGIVAAIVPTVDRAQATIQVHVAFGQRPHFVVPNMSMRARFARTGEVRRQVPSDGFRCANE